MSQNYSFVTVICNERYIPGVIALKRALEETKTKYPFHVLIPEEQKNILKPQLVKHGIKIITRPNIIKNNGSEYSNHHWNNTFFKIAVTSLVEFDKIVFLDSDMLILNNIDELFLKSNLSAVVAGKTFHPEWVELNSGLMVIEPELSMYDKLVEEIDNTIEERNQKGLPCGDQDVFARAFPEWKNNEELHLDEKYNSFFSYLNAYFKKKIYKRKKDVSIVHFVGTCKPWEYNFKRKVFILVSSLKNLNFKTLWYYKKYIKLTKTH